MDIPELFDAKIKQRTFIKATPEKVFKTITSASEWDKFFTTGMTLEPTQGGQCRFMWKDWGPDFYSLEVPGEVVEIDPPTLFSFAWGSGDNKTTVRFELQGKHEGTVLTITEDGYQDTPKHREAILDCASGWGEAATLLKFYMEHGTIYTAPKK